MGNRRWLLTGIMCGSLFSFCPSDALASDSDIVVTEVAAFEKSDHEWIEIVNRGSDPVDISGWKFFESGTNHGLTVFRGDFILEQGEFAVIADVAANTTADYPSFQGTLFDSSWQTLSESGELIALKNKSGQVIEQFTYIASKDRSLERKDPSLSDYSEKNWNTHQTSNSIGQKNSAWVETGSLQSPSAAYGFAATWKPSHGDVVINEFVADPPDDEVEWVELYNATDRIINLSGWVISDGSGALTILSGTLGLADASRFLVVERPKGGLSNEGDLIKLLSPDTRTIDEVAYGSWDDGNIKNNAPRAQDPQSVARIKDGANTFHNSNDFSATAYVTKGSANRIVREGDEEEEEARSGSIVISELLPHPIESEGQQEFIELYNTNSSDVDLTGWRLTLSNGQEYIISGNNETPLIKQGEYKVFFRSRTKLAMKNDRADTVRLFQPRSIRASSIATYKDHAEHGWSYARNEDGGYGWTVSHTPGSQNVITIKNRPPVSIASIPARGIVGEDIVFDASDSFDLDNNPLFYTWDFGDGTRGEGISPNHRYMKAGSYKVIFSLFDGEKITQDDRVIKVNDRSLDVRDDEEVRVHGKGVVINELYPNPPGRDTGEFIELQDTSDQPLNLVGWYLASEKTGRTVHIPARTAILHGLLLVIQKDDGIGLLNGGDRIALFSPDGKEQDAVEYDKAPEGVSYAHDAHDGWKWTRTPTPGENNTFRQASPENSRTVKTRSRQKGARVLMSTSVPSLSNMKAIESGAFVRVKGVVTVAPNTFSPSFFYMSGSGGLQIYSSSKNFPKLERGDSIEVFGAVSHVRSGTRVRIKAPSDITVLSSDNAVLPTQLELASLKEEDQGSLVTVRGTVGSIRWPSFALDDGSDEIRVYVKKSTHIKKIAFQEEDQVMITGILDKTESGFRLLPRLSDDIQIHPSEEKKDISVPLPPTSRQRFYSYLFVLLASVLAVGLGLMIQYRS